jgi:hypothetical protein
MSRKKGEDSDEENKKIKNHITCPLPHNSTRNCYKDFIHPKILATLALSRFPKKTFFFSVYPFFNLSLILNLENVFQFSLLFLSLLTAINLTVY